MDIHRSARKHGVRDDDIRHALAFAVAASELDDDEPLRSMVIGPDAAGNLRELVVLEFDDGRTLVIHAMSLRVQYRWMLEPFQEEP